MRTRTLPAGTISLCLAALLRSVSSAHSQSQLAPVLQHRLEKLGGVTLPALRFGAPVHFSSDTNAAGCGFLQPAVDDEADVSSGVDGRGLRPSSAPRPQRRSQNVAHDRFENEAPVRSGHDVAAVGAAAGRS